MGNIINHPSILHKNNTISSLELPSQKNPNNSLSKFTSLSLISPPTKLGLAIISSLSNESKTFEESLVDYPKNNNNKGTFFVPQFKINVPTLSLYYTKPIYVAPKEIIETSEEYTRITLHCPKTETTHMFGNYILKCHKKEFVFPSGSIHNGEIIGTQYKVANIIYDGSASTSAACVTPIIQSRFLKTCYACKKTLHRRDDIYIYTSGSGDASFCSLECRFDEIMTDEHNAAVLREKIKKMENLGKKKMSNRDISGKKVVFFVGEKALSEM